MHGDEYGATAPRMTPLKSPPPSQQHTEPDTPLSPVVVPKPRTFIRVASPADGDCLFHSVRIALQTYSGEAAERLRLQLLSVGIDVAVMTATDIRRVVYSLFLLPHSETDAIMSQWQAMVTVDPELAIEYGQARCLVGKNVDALTESDRTQFFTACMDRRITWGDEYALYFVERLLRIRCMVVFNAALQSRQYGNYVEGFDPIVYVPLHLRGSHYETVSFDGQSAFSFSEIPPLFVEMARRDCAHATETYITLTGKPSCCDKTSCTNLHGHFFLCKVIADKTPMPVYPTYAPNALSSACMRPHVDADMDIEDGSDVSDLDGNDDDDVLVDVTGGDVYIGFMPARVSRMQCGVSVALVGPPVPNPSPSSFPTDRFAIRTAPLLTRLPFKQHVHVW